MQATVDVARMPIPANADGGEELVEQHGVAVRRRRLPAAELVEAVGAVHGDLQDAGPHRRAQRESDRAARPAGVVEHQLPGV